MTTLKKILESEIRLNTKSIDRNMEKILWNLEKLQHDIESTKKSLEKNGSIDSSCNNSINALLEIKESSGTIDALRERNSLAEMTIEELETA